MNKERLARLAEIMDRIPKEAFNLSGYVNDIEDPDIDNVDPDKYDAVQVGAAMEDTEDFINIPHACGATCCALGYAGLDPLFRRDGFKTYLVTGLVSYEHLEDGEYKDSGGFIGASKFFDIEMDTSSYLFAEGRYIPGHRTPKDVANRIRELLRYGETYRNPDTTPSRWL